MLGAAVVAGLVIGGGAQLQRESPFPSLPSVRIQSRLASVGVAQGMARSNNLQARVLWVDGTANLEAMSTPEKARGIVRRAADGGFNTVVLDVKPIVGRTLYPSKLTPQMTSWKGQSMPEGHDPLKFFCEEARAHGISLFVSLNAFAEGHSYAKRDEGKEGSLFGDAGWGYNHPELQTYNYVPQPNLTLSPDQNLTVHPVRNATTWGNAEAAVFTNGAPLKGTVYAALDSQGDVVDFGTTAPPTPSMGSLISFRSLENSEAVLWKGRRLEFEASSGVSPAAESQTQIPLMMNPHHHQNQERARAFIEEVCKYDIDGVIYDDRLRFGGLKADFSPYTMRKFANHLGRESVKLEEIYTIPINHRLNAGLNPFIPGPLFEKWIAWRTMEMKDFVKSVRDLVDSRGKKLAAYAGAWYGSYNQYGANYGSTELDAGFLFLSNAYKKQGFAGLLDFLITGCYYKVPTIHDSVLKGSQPGRTVEAGGLISNRVVRDQTWTYAGIMLQDYWDNPEGLADALQAAAATSQGVMVFDYSHKVDDYWNVFERAFSDKKKAPHQVDLLGALRARREEWDRLGHKDPPFPLLPGAPGVGF